MKRKNALLLVLLMISGLVLAQQHAYKNNYKSVNTYVNPVLPGDHPDPTLLKVGDDFYHCGSTFHFTPYMPIYHSKDLVHWKIIGRILSPENAKWVEDRPSAGIWQGAITYFYGSYWVYFSSGGQWFCKADSPTGPWSDPIKLKTNPETGPLGYDNSIFVDDDGTPYIVIKNGQYINRLQAIGIDGQLKGKVINLDWINAKRQYSWAEGPVMCKRNGYYYYFPAGDVSGGQYVLRSKELTSDSTKWERLGDFFKPITDNEVGFRRPNHIAAPVQLADGSWWTLGQSYEKYPGNDWAGTGRQTSLYPVIWEGDRPWGMAPTTQPITKPALSNPGMSWRSVSSDDFRSKSLEHCWHFLTKKAASRYSLTDRVGWVRLNPDSVSAHLMQKETDHYYSVITKVDLNATNTAAKAGIYLSNGNQIVNVKLYTGYDAGPKIIFSLDTAIRSLPNKFGNIVWLKLERVEHNLTAFCSGNGKTWISLGRPISAVSLDKEQPNYNSWVGTSVGLFAEGHSADFDMFVCKDAFSVLSAVGFSNFYGIKTIDVDGTKVVTTDSENGGWLMISGVDFGNRKVKKADLNICSEVDGELELWADDLDNGKLLSKIKVLGTDKSQQFKLTSQLVRKISGSHDVFLRFSKCKANSILIKDLIFK
jgi:Beta-xylosidase